MYIYDNICNLECFSGSKIEIFPNIDPAWVTKCQFNELTEI
jgi:hypothetical protein